MSKCFYFKLDIFYQFDMTMNIDEKIIAHCLTLLYF